MNVAWTILRKDLLGEWRSRDRVLSMLIFSLLMAVAFFFALPDARPADWVGLLPGLLWTAYVFSSLLGLNRSLALELENDALSGLALAPGNRGFVFLGKALANFVLISLVEFATAAVFALLFGVDLIDAAPSLALVVSLGTFGIASIGTLLGAMAVRTRFRELLLPILLLPALFPVLAGAVDATRAAVYGLPLPFEAIQLLIVIDGIYLVVGFLGFDYILLDE
jgi:heme exporter protein B